MMNNDELYHYGVLGMKWGHRKAQSSSSGNLRTSHKAKVAAKRQLKAAQKHQKLLRSTDPNYIYKHRNELSDEEFDKVYDKAYKVDNLKKMAYGDRSVSKEIAINAGKQVTSLIIKTSLAAGSVAFLTKTETGRKLVSKGKQAAVDILKKTAENAAKSTVNTAKNVAKTATTAAANTAKNVAKTASTAAVNAAHETRSSTAKNFSKAVRSGNRAASSLYQYGKTVDELIRRRRR